MFTKRNSLCAAMCFFMAASLCFGRVRDSVVITSQGCSGVNVHPDGYILTAWHCGSPDSITATFSDGRSVVARKHYEAYGS